MGNSQYSALKYVLMAGAVLLAPVAAQAQESLRDEIRILRERLAQLEGQVGKDEKDKKRRISAAAAVEAGDRPRSWKLPGTNTSMNIGGYVKFDAVWDFQASPGDAIGIFQPGGVPGAEGTAADNRGNGGNFRFHARQSRLWVQTWTPTDWGELRTYIETDFFGGGNNPFPAGFAAGTAPGVLRLRHAYGTLGPVLAGQTWSTFMPVFAGPDTLDFGGPTGQIFVRQAMVRYTHNFGGGLQLQLALEDPSGDSVITATGPAGLSSTSVSLVTGAVTPTFAGDIGAQRYPDAVAAITYSAPWGQLWAAGMVRQIEHDSGGPVAAGRSASADSVTTWGAAIAGVFKVMPRVDIGFEANAGTGTGKYLAASSGFADAILTGTNRLKGIMKYGAKGWVQVQLTDTVSVLGAYGYAQQDVDEEVSKGVIPAGTPHYSWSAQGNIQWKPVPMVTFGAEYSHFFGSRFNGPNATVSRVQFSAIYRF